MTGAFISQSLLDSGLAVVVSLYHMPLLLGRPPSHSSTLVRVPVNGSSPCLQLSIVASVWALLSLAGCLIPDRAFVVPS